MEEDDPKTEALQQKIQRIWRDLQTTPEFPPWPMDSDLPWESAGWSCHHYLQDLKRNRQKLM
eukprot:2351430-Amphidinium_carterae.1